MDPIIFAVGDKYTNEKGSYEVIGLDGDTMTIRWENGETVRTAMELQKNIIRRRQLDQDRLVFKSVPKAKAKAKGKARQAPKRGKAVSKKQDA